MDTLKALFKQPSWVIVFLVGAVFAALPFITVDKDYHLASHPPTTPLPLVIGLATMAGALAFAFWQVRGRTAAGADAFGGLDLTSVKASGDELWTNVNGCEIRVAFGRIEDYRLQPGAAVVLPCNEYFDDRCVGDTRSALGAYANRIFNEHATKFAELITHECKKKWGEGDEQQKTDEERARSFGVGKCLLLVRPLGNDVPVALVSTTTQRPGEGLSARISYMFDGMREVFKHLADARIREVVMPIIGSGHGQIDPPMAFVGLLLAIAEAARYGQGGQRLRKATVVVLKRDAGPVQVDKVVVRRALALVGSNQ